MKNKMRLSEKLKFYKEHMPKNALFEKEENALFDEWIEQAKENEELVESAIDALGNCNEDICPCIEDVLSYLEAIKEG